MYQRVGTAFGKYQVRRVLGVGGMATVYYALAAHMAQPIALKILSTQYADIQSFRQRFEFEAHLTALLAHPHIVPVLDYGAVDHELFLAMPYMAGGSLHDRFVLDGAISLQETGRLLFQLADALDYAHSQGVIHRDLKLANVLLDERNNAQLSDFGIARLAESNLHLTESGSVLGSPHYMSPEQNEGRPLDARSDLYALAVMVYLMVTGQFPFHAETALAIALQHINKEPQPPSAIAPDLPPALDAVLLKGLAKSPAQRFDSAASFYNAFMRALGTFDTRTAIRVAQLSKVAAASVGNGHSSLSNGIAGDGSPFAMRASQIGMNGDSFHAPIAPDAVGQPAQVSAAQSATPSPVILAPVPDVSHITAVHPALSQSHFPGRRAPLLLGAVTALGVIIIILVMSFSHLNTVGAIETSTALTDALSSSSPEATTTAAKAPITATRITSLIFPTNTPNIVIPASPKFIAISKSLNNPVNVRAGPDKGYAVITQLHPSDQGVILARTLDSTDQSVWYLISVNGATDSIGWVLGSVIVVLPTDSDANAIPTAATRPAPPTRIPTPLDPRTATVIPRG